MKHPIESNLEAVKEVAYTFLNMDVEVNKDVDFLVDHPIFETVIASVTINNHMELVDITKDNNNFELAKEAVRKTIKRCDDVFGVVCVIRKSYRLTFLKYIKNDLSQKDFSKILNYVWISTENPNGDVNVSINELIKWFKYADKESLMNEDDYKIYQELREKENITVYRGVAVNRNPNGLSWTNDLDKAIWFAERYNSNDNVGYVQKAIVNRNQILAYLDERGEREIVVDTRKIKIEILNNYLTTT